MTNEDIMIYGLLILAGIFASWLSARYAAKSAHEAGMMEGYLRGNLDAAKSQEYLVRKGVLEIHPDKMRELKSPMAGKLADQWEEVFRQLKASEEANNSANVINTAVSTSEPESNEKI